MHVGLAQTHSVTARAMHPILDLITDMKTSQKYIISICIPSLHQIDRLLVWLPRCGKPDYIHKFIQCLRESSDDAGDAHSELADVLQEYMEQNPGTTG